MRFNRCSGALAAGLLALSGVFIPHAHASVITLLNWAAVPDGGMPNFPVINYTGANLQTDIGAQSNGDGNQPVSNQIPGGLQVDTTVNAPVAFSFPSSVFTGGTGYYDVSMNFTGLAPVGAATNNGGVDMQNLGPGTFTLNASTVAGSVALLTGTIQSGAMVIGINNSNVAAAFDAHGITYTGGAIRAAFPANYSPTGNDMSISMIGVAPPLGINGVTGQLNAFKADATGLFDVNVVPEPGMLSLALVGAGALVMRRRRSA